MNGWLNLIAVIAAILATGSAVISLRAGRKHRELIGQNNKQIEQMLAEAKAARDVGKDVAQQQELAPATESDADGTVQHADLLERVQSGQNSDEQNAAIAEAVSAIRNNPTADPILRLRAEAIAASQPDQAEKAYKLWSALTALAPTDANVHFNAAYWAQLSSKDSELSYWSKQTQEHYSAALNIRPDFHEAANNWGVTLSAEAQTLIASNPDIALKRWKRAGEKYQQALSIKPDYYEAANNWGNVLAMEAQVIAASDLKAAQQLSQQAGEKYRQALDIQPDNHNTANNWANILLTQANVLATTDKQQADALRNHAEQLLLQHAQAAPGLMAYNLACVSALRGDASACVNWLKTCQTHNTLVSCPHLKTDADLDGVRTSPEFIEWLEGVCKG